MAAIRFQEQIVTCGKKARLITEAGIIEVCCTLESHEDNMHYDDAFSLTWRSE